MIKEDKDMIEKENNKVSEMKVRANEKTNENIIGFQRGGQLVNRKYKEYFLPTVLTAMAMSMSIIVDGMIVGNILGTDALAAVNLATPFIMIYNTIAVFFGMGGATAISIAKGQRQDKYANEVFSVSIVSMVLLGIILTLAQFPIRNQIVSLIVQDPVLEPLVRDYVFVIILGTPLFILVLGMSYIIRTDGKPKLASNLLIIANVVNLSLDLLYMGVFDMGIKGASLATVTGYFVGVFVMLFYVFSKERTLHIRFDFLLKILDSLKLSWQIILVGSPSAVASILMTLKILFLNIIVLSIAGNSGMVAFSVCLSCLSLVSMFIAGASQTMIPLVGSFYGERDFNGIVYAVKRAFSVLILACIIIFLLLESFPQTVLHFFGVTGVNDIAIGVSAIRVFAISMIGTSVTYFMMYYYMTVQKRKIATAITVVQGFAIVVPCAYVLGEIFGVMGIWISFSVAEIVTIAMIMLYYMNEKRKQPGKYHNLLLLKKSQEEQRGILDITIDNNVSGVLVVSEKIQHFLYDSGIDRKLSNKVAIAIEEMSVNISKYAYKQGVKNYIDIRLKLCGDEIIISIRDDGVFFDPTKYNEKETEREGYAIGGIKLIETIAKEMSYSRVLGMNNTNIVI